MADEKRDVLASLAQRRQVHAHLEAREEVGAECVVVAVGRSDEAQVDAPRVGVAQDEALSFVEDAQHLGLSVPRELADFVEEQRPAVGRPDEARASGHLRAGVAPEIAEELRGHQRLRDGLGVGRDHGPAGSPRVVLDERCGELLARAALALDEDVIAHRGGRRQLRAQGPRRGRLADDAVGVRLAEGVQLAQTRGTNESPGPEYAEEEQLALEEHRVARPQRRLGLLRQGGPVDVRGGIADHLDLQLIAPAAHLEQAAGEGLSGEDLLVRVDGGSLAGTLADEVREPVEIVVASADEEPLAEREERDLADAVRLRLGPRDDEGEAGRNGVGGDRAGGGGGGRLAGARHARRWALPVRLPARKRQPPLTCTRFRSTSPRTARSR